jgi:hypothetical protein
MMKKCPFCTPRINKTVFILLIACLCYFNGSNFAFAQTKNRTTPPAKYDAIKNKAQEILIEQVKDRLKDPFSVRFKKLVLYSPNVKTGNKAILPKGEYTLCGELNAKSPQGGYTGFRMFISTMKIPSNTGDQEDWSQFVWIDSDDPFDSKRFVRTYLEMCSGDK